jgi:hypothetical protein
MLNAITDVPPSVIGFEAAGKLTAEDYRDVLLPAIQNAAASGEVRIVIVMPAFDGFTRARFGKTSRWAWRIGAHGSASPWSPMWTG